LQTITNSAVRSISSHFADLQRSIARVVKGKEDVIQLALVALLARGHLLVEDVPGVGKTTLAQALARSFHCSFQRIQFTSDLLPSDVIGVSVYNPATQEFEFKPGPIFANVIVADEINRTTPKTQSALLEAMSESQITIRIRCPNPSWCSPRKIPSSITAPIRCPNRSSIAFSCASAWAIPREPARRKSFAIIPALRPSIRLLPVWTLRTS
jgi:MoxR-like ATPase